MAEVHEQHKVQAALMQSYRDIFLHTPQGQDILFDLMKVSGLYQISGIRSAEEIQHAEGGRDMVRRIFSILALDEEQITKLALGIEGNNQDG
tara:strand:+ start:33 stop:308 length:276 start_codon:yes stop_codon:yes gene_type:complete